MTSEVDRQQDEQARARSPDAVLWDDVRFWADAIMSVFGDLAHLAQVGLTRSLGVKLCNWLWGVEGAVRRLIIAAALNLLSSDAAPTQRSPHQRTERAARRRRPSFRILGFNSTGEALPAGNAPGAAPRTMRSFGHIVFPADSLLSIGPRRKRPRAASPRSTNARDLIARTFETAHEAPEDHERALLGLSPAPRRRASTLPRASAGRQRSASRFDPHSWKSAERNGAGQFPRHIWPPASSRCRVSWSGANRPHTVSLA